MWFACRENKREELLGRKVCIGLTVNEAKLACSEKLRNIEKLFKNEVKKFNIKMLMMASDEIIVDLI